MSGHKYITNSGSLFADDVDDDTFVDSYRSRIPPPQPKPVPHPYGGGHISDIERQRQVMLQRQRDIEQRTLDSSSRSIGLLRESEDIGIATAEELSRQREVLQTTNKRLDEINTNLSYSQKHLNGIKSVFYGLKSYISGKSDQPPSRSQGSPDTQSTYRSGPSSQLEETINNMTRDSRNDLYSSHPSTRLRGLDESNAAGPESDSQRINKKLDDNLDEMLVSITRLKGLGVALGDEIEQQNGLIDKIQDKVEGADIKIGSQNKQMNKLLGK